MKNENILLVDDEPEILSALKLRLGRKFNIYTTTSPQQGLQIIKNDGPFSVVVSDFKMPDMNGLEFLLEANRISPETSSILLTGQGEYDTAIQALNSGKIFKYLSKPCETDEINEALVEAVLNFKTAVNRKQSLKEYDNENRVAKIVQDQLLFTKFKPLNDKVELTALSTPKGSVSGDFYEIIPHTKDCFDLIIADVMGKGLPAAILGAAVKNSIMHQVQCLKSLNGRLPSISEIVKEVEKETHGSLFESRMFITMFYARINLQSNSITYISNGHPGSLIVRENSPEVLYLQSNHMPLGIMERDFFNSITFKLKPNDKLIFYTDGISEALLEGPKSDPVELILDCLDGDEKSTEVIANKIFNQAKLKRGVEDDMTVISMNLNNGIKDMEPLTFIIQKNLNEIYKLSKIISESAGTCDEMFNVAIMETFTNIVKHSGDSKRAVRLVCTIDEKSKKVFEFIYEGPHFEPLEIKLPDCSKQVSGFGLYLVEKICKSVVYEIGKNDLTKIKLSSK